MHSDGDPAGGLYLAPALYATENTPGPAAEVDALERVAGRYATARSPFRRWLEPACGTGRYLRVLRGRGQRVAGYDPLPAMLTDARRRLARWSGGWRLANGSFTTPSARLIALGPADVAFCPVNSLRHLHCDEDVLAHFEQIGRLLAPGAVYVVGLDLHQPGALPDEDVWEAARGQLQVRQVVQYLPPESGERREQVVVQMMVTRPRGQEHHGWTYDLRTYTEAQWHDLVAGSTLKRLATCDANGRPVEGAARLPYQLEVLTPR